MLDWQLVPRGPAVQDVALFLTQSLPTDIRRRNERALVQHWHGQLGRRPDYPFDLAWTEYRRMVVFSTVYPVLLSVGLEVSHDRMRAVLETMVRRIFTAALDGDT